MLAAGLLVFGLSSAGAPAAVITLSAQPVAGGIRLTATEDVSSYYIYYISRDSPALQGFAPVAMSMGESGAIWDVPTAGFARRYWTVRQVPAYAPEDSDGDGIDDVYEIRHPILNPLNPADALTVVPGLTITYLAESRALYGLGTARPEVYSREASFWAVTRRAASRRSIRGRSLSSMARAAPRRVASPKFIREKSASSTTPRHDPPSRVAIATGNDG